MPSMSELIDAHRQAFVELNKAAAELEAADDANDLARSFVLPSLLSPEPDEWTYWGKDYKEASHRLWDHYNSLLADLWWLKRTDMELFDRLSTLLADMQVKNRRLAQTAWRNHVKAKAAAQARLDAANTRWAEVNDQEKQAAIELLRRRAATPEEHAERAEYLRESELLDHDNFYHQAIVESVLGDVAYEAA